MEEKKKEISLLVGTLIKESAFKYLKISHPKEDGSIIVKTDANSKTLTEVLDEFFDLGYSVNKISKLEFVNSSNPKNLKFNIK